MTKSSSSTSATTTNPWPRNFPAPDLVIYLQAKPEVLRARIAKKALPAKKRKSPSRTSKKSPAPTNISSSATTASRSAGHQHFEIDFVERSADLQQLLPAALQDPVKGTQYSYPPRALLSAALFGIRVWEKIFNTEGAE